MTQVAEIAPEDRHHDFSPEVLRELRRLRANKSGPTYSMDEVFSELGIDLEALRVSMDLPSGS